MTLTPERSGSPARSLPAPRRLRRPRVSVIIPAYDEAASIERCVLAVADQSVAAHEILVVDNRSTDATAAIVARLVRDHPRAGIRLLHQDAVQGLVPTRNAGFAAATGDVLGRIDADTVVARDWVERVGEQLGEPGLGGVTGPVSYHDVTLARARRLSDNLVRRAVLRLGSRYPFLYGSNMAIRTDAWRAIDACLDPEDLFHEDIDLAVHLHDAGLPVLYCPRMRASVSARRLDTTPRSFRDYTGRFARTYAAHDVEHWYLKVPPVILQTIYWPAWATRHLLMLGVRVGASPVRALPPPDARTPAPR